MTMFYFSFISDVRADLFFNVLKTTKHLRNAETMCLNVFIPVLFHVCERLK